MRTEDHYLVDIIIAADAVAQYVRDVTWAQFLAERIIRSAVIHELQIIGEAVARLSQELRQRYPTIPWPEIIGFRNVVVHEYFGVNPELVWNTALYNAPEIRRMIANVLQVEYPVTYQKYFG